MHQLPRPGNFVVKGLSQKFCQVDPDQAHNWINSIGQRGGGIVGITKTTSALCQWTLSYNLRSHIAADTYKMYDMSIGQTHVQHEAQKSRQIRDREDENSLVSTFQRILLLKK